MRLGLSTAVQGQSVVLVYTDGTTVSTTMVDAYGSSYSLLPSVILTVFVLLFTLAYIYVTDLVRMHTGIGLLLSFLELIYVFDDRTLFTLLPHPHTRGYLTRQ